MIGLGQALSVGLPSGKTPGGGFVGALDGWTANRLFAGSFRRRLFSDHDPELGLFEIRRSSDDDDVLIQPGANGEASAAAITGFVGSGNHGYAKSLIDQSGHGNNQAQAVTSQQLQMVEAGSLVTVGGKPAARGGRTTYLDPVSENRGTMHGDLPSYAGNTLSLFLRFSHDTYGGWFHDIVDAYFALVKNSGTANEPGSYNTYRKQNEDTITLGSNWGALNLSLPLASDGVMSFIWDGNTVTIRDGVNTASVSWTGGLDINKLVLCGLNDGDGSQYSAAAKRVQEIVIWTSDQTSNEAAIRSAMMS